MRESPRDFARVTPSFPATPGNLPEALDKFDDSCEPPNYGRIHPTDLSLDVFDSEHARISGGEMSPELMTLHRLLQEALALSKRR